MLTELNKKEIYNLLKTKLSFGEAYSLAEVGKELTLSGHGCRRYGYARMKSLMKELNDFIEVTDYEYDGHSNSNVTLRMWTPTVSSSGRYWGSTASEMAEVENEMGGGLLRVPSMQRRKEKEENKNNNQSDIQDFTATEKEKVYQILSGKFEKDTPMHMAKISKYLVERGFSPRAYGFMKMKAMLKEIPEHLTLEDVVINGVPNVLVTLHDEPQSGKQAIAPAEVEKIAEPAEEAKPVQEQEEAEVVRPQPQAAAPREKLSDFERLTYLPTKILDFLRRRNVENPEQLLAKAYQESLENKTVQVRSYSISFPVILEGGEELIAILKRNERPHGRAWYLSYVGSPKQEQKVEEEEREEDHPIPPGKSLEHFADLGYWPAFLKELADLALPEKWDAENQRFGRYFVLKKYMQYTFYRLLQENKVCISKDGQFAAFNTGLVNKHYDDIYACFVPNPEQDKEPWKFEEFAMAGIRGKNGNGKKLTMYFDPLPQVPQYVERNEDLIYDLSKELLTDYEHIIIDNLRRLPLGYLRECCYGDEEALELINSVETKRSGSDAKKQAYAVLSQYIDDHDKIFRRLRSRMEDAIEIALKRVRWNFRTAIPCYFPKGNCMSLMLPLCLEDDSHTDAALVVQKNLSGSYQGQTVLSLDQAYLDARLICRPNADWLQSEAPDLDVLGLLQS